MPDQSIRDREPLPAVDGVGAPVRASRTLRGASGVTAAAIAALVLLACLARLVFPNADPSMPTWIGYVVDEGRWNQSARSLALFGTLDSTAVARLHLFLAPGYQVVNFVVFKGLGIDFWSARAFSAIAGIALVVVPVLVLRRLVSPLALAVGVVLLGFEGNLLAASRLAFPEIPAALGTMLAFLLLVRGRKTRLNAFVAGSLAAFAVAMKATTVLVIPILPLIVLFSVQDGRLASRVARALAFVGGFTVWVAGGLAFVLVSGLMSSDTVLHSSSRLVTYLSLTGPFITVMRFFESVDLEARNLLLLGAWLGSWAWWYRDRRAPAGLVEFYLASGAWALWWLVTWSGSHYLPGRYVIHFVVPATLHVVAGLALLRRDLPEAIASSLQQGRGWRRAFALGWLVVPTAILVAALGAGWLDRFGIDSSRLAARVGAIAVVATALALALRRRCDRPGVVGGLLAFPLVLVVLWLAAREFGWLEHFWQRAGDMASWLVWGLPAIAALLAAALVRLRARDRGRPVLATIAVAMLGGVLLLQNIPALLAPTYSVRDASLDLGRRLATAKQVRSFSAESMFLANRVPFRTLQSTDRDYDALVIFEHGAQSARFLGSGRQGGLERVMTYPIAHHPRYRTQESLFGPASVALFLRPR